WLSRRLASEQQRCKHRAEKCSIHSLPLNCTTHETSCLIACTYSSSPTATPKSSAILTLLLRTQRGVALRTQAKYLLGAVDPHLPGVGSWRAGQMRLGVAHNNRATPKRLSTVLPR